MNSFVDIVNKTAQNKWCVSPYCTACGNREIRNEFHNAAGLGGAELAKQLSEITPSEIRQGCIETAFIIKRII